MHWKSLVPGANFSQQISLGNGSKFSMCAMLQNFKRANALTYGSYSVVNDSFHSPAWNFHPFVTVVQCWRDRHIITRQLLSWKVLKIGRVGTSSLSQHITDRTKKKERRLEPKSQQKFTWTGIRWVSVKRKVYDYGILPMLTYAGDTWHWTKHRKRNLRSAEKAIRSKVLDVTN